MVKIPRWLTLCVPKKEADRGLNHPQKITLLKPRRFYNIRNAYTLRKTPEISWRELRSSVAFRIIVWEIFLIPWYSSLKNFWYQLAWVSLVSLRIYVDRLASDCRCSHALVSQQPVPAYNTHWDLSLVESAAVKAWECKGFGNLAPSTSVPSFVTLFNASVIIVHNWVARFSVFCMQKSANKTKICL